MAPSRKCAAFVYLLLCSDGTVYTGWTYDVARRLLMHQNGHGARYTRSRGPLRLIYQEQLPSRKAAMLREVEIKRWSHARKLEFAEQHTEHKKAHPRRTPKSKQAEGNRQ